MEEPHNFRHAGPVLIKKGERIPENATPMSNVEILAIQERLLKNVRPQSEVRSLNYGTHLLSSFVALSGVMMNNTMRQNFRLGGLRRMFTYVPAVAFSAVFSAGLHEIGIKHQILLGKSSCPTCMSIRSGSYQTFMGLGYTYLISLLTCLPVAREFYTLPMPASQNRMAGYIRLLRQVTPQSSLLLFIGVSNMVLGMWIAQKELQAFHKHLSRRHLYYQADATTLRE